MVEGKGQREVGRLGGQAQQRPGRILMSFFSLFPFCPCSSPAACLSVSDPPQGRGRSPGTVLQPCLQLHHQQHLWGEGGECWADWGRPTGCSPCPQVLWTYRPEGVPSLCH